MILIKTDNMKKETLEEFIESYINRIDRSEDGLVEQCLKDGVKWKQERISFDISEKWIEYRNITNNEDAYLFMVWLKEQFKKK